MDRWRRLLPLLVGGGVVAIAVYAAGLGPEAPAETTTTTTNSTSLLEDPLSGPALEWEQLGDVGSGIPLALGRVGDSHFVFAAADDLQVIQNRGGYTDQLLGWRSADLREWEPLPIPAMAGVSWGPAAFDAAGIAISGADGRGRALVMTSRDGEAWTTEELPTPEGTWVWVQGGLWHQGTLLLYGIVSRQPPGNVLADALPDDLRDAVADGDLWPYYDEMSGELTLYGPMDLPVYQTTVADLGVNLPPQYPYPEGVTVWTRGDDAAWRHSVVLPNGSLSTGGDTVSGFALYGSSGGTLVTLTSPDGVDWDTRNTTRGPSQSTDPVARWGDRMVTWFPGSTGLYVAADRDWQVVQLPPGLLPTAGTEYSSWRTTQVAPGGMGMVVTTTREQVPEEEPSAEPLRFAQNGYRLQWSWQTGLTMTDASGAEVARIPANDSAIVHPAVRYDPAARAVTIVDPDDGTVLVTVTTDEWNQVLASQQAFPTGDIETRLVFTRDVETWSAATPPWVEIDPAAASNAPILVEDARALVVAVDSTGATPTMSIWQGTLP